MTQPLVPIPFVFVFLFLFLFFSNLTASQSPAAAPALPAPVAASPAPAGPPNVISILNKDGRFTVFSKLLQSTKVDASLDSQLTDSHNGLTVFAPTDTAFSSLKTGTLNSFTDEQKTELVRFHVLPTHISPSQFETVSNPISTQAGGSPDLLAMNVTAVGSSVNITTGETNTTVSNAIFDDSQLAVYQVDRVLLPMRFYVPLPPPPPPPPSPKKPSAKAAPVYVAPVESSAGKWMYNYAMAGLVLVVAALT